MTTLSSAELWNIPCSIQKNVLQSLPVRKSEDVSE